MKMSGDELFGKAGYESKVSRLALKIGQNTTFWPMKEPIQT
jgi:hypothetical protein